MKAALVFAAVSLSGCGLMPQHFARLDEARVAADEAAADPKVVRYAATELQHARTTLDEAQRARDTLQDPAVVEHLAYLARQRFAIARERAKLEAARTTTDAAQAMPRQ